MRPRPHPTASLRVHLLSLVVGAVTAAGAAAQGQPHPPVKAEPTPDPAPDELDRPTFLARLVAGDPRVAAVRARSRAARGDVRAARALPNPVVTYEREEVFDDGEGIADQIAALSWSIDLSGARGRRIAAARAGELAAARESEWDERELLLAGLDRFIDAAFLRLEVDVLRQSRSQLAALVVAVERRQSRGDLAGADLDRAALELGAHDDLLARAELDLDGARADLARLVGRAGHAVDAAASALDLPTMPGAVDQLVAEARATRPDRRAALARAVAAAGQASAARRGWVPGLSLSGGLKSSDLGDRTATGYVLGVGLTLPLFDRGQGAQLRAEAEQSQHAATARAIDAELVSEVRAAHRALVSQIARAREFARTRLPRADALVRSAESAYREGERPLFELLDAYRTARDTRLAGLELRRAARRAELRLLRATGRKP